MRSSAAMLLAACALGCADAPVQTGAIIVVEASAETQAVAAEAAVRAWDTENVLVLDRLVAIGTAPEQVTMPFAVPLRPRDDGSARWYRVEVDLLDSGGCPIARGSARGTFDAGDAPQRSVRVEPLGHAPCVAVYVDGNAPDGADQPEACTNRATPCKTIQYALDTYADAARTNVTYVRGGVTYTAAGTSTSGVVRLLTAVSGTALAPTVVRAWPGTSLAVASDGTSMLAMPRIDAAGSHDSAIFACCTSSGASFTVVDGLELTGAVQAGLQYNTNGVDDNVVRNSWIHDNGLVGPKDLYFYSGIKVANDAARNVIEYNIIENNGVGRAARGIIVHNRMAGIATYTVIRFNRITGNAGDGVSMSAAGGVVEGNVLCDNAEGGVVVGDGSVRVLRNTVVRNGPHGIEVNAGMTGVEIRDNLIAFDLGMGLTDQGIDTVRSHNLFFENAAGASGDPTSGDVIADPMIGAGCDVAPRPSSPAFGAASDGGDIGAYALSETP